MKESFPATAEAFFISGMKHLAVRINVLIIPGATDQRQRRTDHSPCIALSCRHN
jgi:hypothetical protein